MTLPGSKEEDRKREDGKNQKFTITPYHAGKDSKKRDQDVTTVSMASERSQTIEKVDIKTAERFLSMFKKIIRNDKPLDMVVAALDGIKELFGCQKVTIYPIDFYVLRMTTQNLPKEK